MTDTLTPEDLATTFDAFNRHDVTGVMKSFADDCVFYAAGGPEVYGTKIEGAAAVAEAFVGKPGCVGLLHRIRLVRQQTR